jgi:hypothetical protein
MTKRIALLVSTLALLAACGGPLKYQIASTAQAPGSDANLVAHVAADQGQTRIELTTKNLAPANRVSEKATAYVVWYRKDNSTPWGRVGALKYDADARTGDFEGTVPVTAFDLEVTADETTEGASPSPTVVFSQRVQEQ